MALALVKTENFGWFSVLFYFAVACFLFFRADSHSQKTDNLYSFIVLLFTALGGLTLVHRPEFAAIEVTAFSILFYIVLGIKELIFIRQYQWYAIKNILLLYSLFALFFLADKSSFFLIKYLLMFAALYFIFRGWFLWSEDYFPRRYLLASLLFAFISLQILWVAAILPIGFISSASLMTLVSFLLIDFTRNHFSGTVTKKLILRNAFLAAIALIAIFGTSSWSV
ncbi:MAG: hypothetical protein PHP03_00520 [Candidatus Pacebacteria bacterium]|nr:hypothetical protein [Candidatus Paceibacterota bacterium]